MNKQWWDSRSFVDRRTWGRVCNEEEGGLRPKQSATSRLQVEIRGRKSHAQIKPRGVPRSDLMTGPCLDLTWPWFACHLYTLHTVVLSFSIEDENSDVVGICNENINNAVVTIRQRILNRF